MQKGGVWIWHDTLPQGVRVALSSRAWQMLAALQSAGTYTDVKFDLRAEEEVDNYWNRLEYVAVDA